MVNKSNATTYFTYFTTTPPRDWWWVVEKKIVNSYKGNKQSGRVVVRNDKIKRKMIVRKDLVKKNVKTITFVTTLITI